MASHEHILHKCGLCTVAATCSIAATVCGSAYISEVRKGRADTNMCHYLWALCVDLDQHSFYYLVRENTSLHACDKGNTANVCVRYLPNKSTLVEIIVLSEKDTHESNRMIYIKNDTFFERPV